MVISFVDDLGGPDALTESDRALVRQAAGLIVRSEMLQAAIVNGEDIDENQAIRLANAAARTLAALKRKVRRKAEFDLRSYLAGRKPAA
ncbi:hypothetical protein ACFQU1_04910 [Chelatococcus sp. GCM10030263]